MFFFKFIGVLFELPSLALRNLQIGIILLMSMYKGRTTTINPSSFFNTTNTTNITLTTLLNNLTTTTATPQPLIIEDFNTIRHKQLDSLKNYLSTYTTITDYLLFIASSHKFILFLVFAHLVRSPTQWPGCPSARRRRLSLDDDDFLVEESSPFAVASTNSNNSPKTSNLIASP